MTTMQHPVPLDELVRAGLTTHPHDPPFSFTMGLMAEGRRELIVFGLDPGTVDEIYTDSTEQAVAELYRGAGYEADEPTADDLERLEQARRSLRAAEDALRSLQSSGGDGLPRSQQLELDRQVSNAEEAYNQSVRDRDAAVAGATSERNAAASAVTSADAAVTTATERSAAAEGGVHPDTGVAPTPEEMDELAQALTDAQTAATAAASALAGAEAAIPVITAEYNGYISDAEIDLQIQYASRDETIAASREGVDAASLSQAQESVDDARTSLSRLEAEIGIGFPANELVFLSSLPSQIQTVWSEVGDTPQGPVMTVTGAGLQITSSVPTTDRSLINEGDEALMEDDALGISIRLQVAFVADNPGGSAAADRYFLRFEPIDAVPEEAYDRNLRVTLPFASTDGEVLAVPMAALSAGANGSARVEVERADGTVETVDVIAGLNSRSQGLVEVTPVGADLAEGDRVIVGRDLALGSSDRDIPDETDIEPEAEAEAE